MAAATSALTTPAPAQTASTRPPYGCFKVTSKVHLHESSLQSSAIVGLAEKGEILVKRNRFCSVVTSTCAVRTTGGTEGYAVKSSLRVAPCPAKLSTKLN